MNSDENSVPIQSATAEETFIELSESEMTRSNEYIDQLCSEENMNNVELRRAGKRTREMDQDEIWKTVVRKAKRYGRTEIIDGDRIIQEYKIEVSITCTEKLPKQFGLAKMLKEENIKNVTKVKYINSYKALIHFSDEESAETILHSKKFMENGFKCQKTLEINQSFGVIRDIDLHLSDEEILQGLRSNTTILAVKRLKRKNTSDGHWELSESVRICFKGSSLPSHVYIYDTRANITPYVYPVTQCSRCWRFGHSFRICPSLKIICPKCSKSHANCETTKFRCNNCTGKHMAMAKICPVFIKEKRIRELMAEFNCSYKKAITLYVQPSPQEIYTSQEPPLTTSYITSSEQPEVNVMPDINVTATYASVTKTSQQRSNTNHKVQTQKNRKKMHREKELEMLECGSEMSEDDNDKEQPQNSNDLLDDSNNHRNSNSSKERWSWWLLLKKLKEVILENNSWEDKIKSCINIIIDGLISFIMQFIVDQPCCDFIKQLWITTPRNPC